MSAETLGAGESRRTWPIRTWVRRYGTFAGFVLLLLVFAVLRPATFLSTGNLRNIMEQVSILALVSFTMTIVMVAGDFDLSVGTLASLAGVVCASMLVRGVPVGAALALTLVLGGLLGLLNGVLVAYSNLSAFVATLATMTAFRGVSLWYTDGATLFSGLPEAFRFLGQGRLAGLPVPIVVMLAALALVWLLLEQTTLGRRLYAIGGNAEAAHLAGIGVRRLRALAFVLSGAGAALAGIMLASRLFSAHPLAGEPLMLSSIAAVFLGMTMFKEGEPHALGTLVGVLILGVLGNGLTLLGVNSYLQQILTGAIIVLSVLLSGLARRR